MSIEAFRRGFWVYVPGILNKWYLLGNESNHNHLGTMNSKYYYRAFGYHSSTVAAFTKVVIFPSECSNLVTPLPLCMCPLTTRSNETLLYQHSPFFVDVWIVAWLQHKKSDPQCDRSVAKVTSSSDTLVLPLYTNHAARDISFTECSVVLLIFWCTRMATRSGDDFLAKARDLIFMDAQLGASMSRRWIGGLEATR